jgi:hypothetical protein
MQIAVKKQLFNYPKLWARHGFNLKAFTVEYMHLNISKLFVFYNSLSGG